MEYKPVRTRRGVSIAEQEKHIASAREIDPRFFAVLEGGTNGPLPPAEMTIGWIWCNWIETNCRLGEGDLYGKPPRMAGWQRALYWKLGELNEDGTLRFNLAVLSFGKGAGKSPMGGWMGALSLKGPREPAGWQWNQNVGRRLPIAKPRHSPDVINMASSYEQADLILDEMRTTFEKGPAELVRNAQSQKGSIVIKDARGQARRIPATPKKADGSKATDLLVDEMHEFEGERQERAYQVASGGTVKRRNGLVLIMSTAGHDMSTVFGQLIARGQGGGFQHHELLVYMQGEQDLDPLKDEEIAEGIMQANPLARVGISNVQKLVAQFKSMPLFNAMRYYWNQWTAASEAWLPAGAWENCRDTDGIIDKENFDLPTWIGVDMAKTRDSAAIVTVQRRPDGRLQTWAEIWLGEGELIDQNAIDTRLVYLAQRYKSNLEWIAADPAWWATLPDLEKTKAPWALTENGCLPIVRMPQQGNNMVQGYAQTYRAIVDRVLLHDGDPQFADQIMAAVPVAMDRGWTLKKSKFNRRIDCCPALSGAIFVSTLTREKVRPPKSAIW